MPRITPKSTVAASRAKAATQPKKPKAKTAETKAATGWKAKTVGGRSSAGRTVGGRGSSGRTVGGRGSEGRSVGGRGSDRPSIRPGISVGGGSSNAGDEELIRACREKSHRRARRRKNPAIIAKIPRLSGSTTEHPIRGAAVTDAWKVSRTVAVLSVTMVA